MKNGPTAASGQIDSDRVVIGGEGSGVAASKESPGRWGSTHPESGLPNRLSVGRLWWQPEWQRWRLYPEFRLHCRGVSCPIVTGGKV
jgi:hypothetical protein